MINSFKHGYLSQKIHICISRPLESGPGARRNSRARFFAGAPQSGANSQSPDARFDRPRFGGAHRPSRRLDRISPIARAGREDKTNMRSASRIASPTSWVTSTVVTERSATERGKLALQRERERPIERDERLVEQQERRADGEGARERDAPRKPERQFAGKCARWLAEARAASGALELGRRRCGAPRGECCPRRSATGAAAAPERRRRAAPPAVRPCPRTRRRGRRRSACSVDLPQPDGPISAPTSPASSRKARLARISTSARRRSRRASARCERQAGRGRQRETWRSKG